jgi:hypothetical protein
MKDEEEETKKEVHGRCEISLGVTVTTDALKIKKSKCRRTWNFE